MNFLILITAAMMATAVRSDEQPLELNQKDDIKKVTANVEESPKEELKSKDGDSLQSLPSNQNTQTQYNSLYVDTKANPVQLGIGGYLSAGQYSGQGGDQYSDQSNGQYSGQSISQQPITVYRPVDITDSRYGVDSSSGQQQGYVAQEQPVYAQKSYARQPQVEDSAEGDYKRQPQAAAYVSQPESTSNYRPISSPGISSTYSSPDVKIISHTRTIMPIVYKKPSEQQESQKPPTEEEYDKAVQGNPGGSYAAEQGQNYESEPQNPAIYSKASAGYLPQSQSQYSSGGYRQPLHQEEQQQEVKQNYGGGQQEGPRVPSRYTPIQAHVQVIEEKPEYGSEPKEGYSSPQGSYGSRTQPRPQFKNYKSNGHGPISLLSTPNAFYPPSPPLASLLPPVEQPFGSQKQEDSYNGQDDKPQQLQQRPNEQKMNAYDIEVEPQNGEQPYRNIGQNNGYSAQRDRTPEDYTYGSDDNEANSDQQDSTERYRQKPSYASDEDSSYSNENSYNNGEIGGQKPVSGDRFRPEGHGNNVNAIGPKYNHERGPAYERGAPIPKPQDIEYGFIPLTEVNLKQMAGYGPEGYNRGQNYENRGKPEESYSDEGIGGVGGGNYGHGNGGYGGGQRRPNFGNGGEYNGENSGENNGENIGQMYGRGNGGDGPRGRGYGPAIGGPAKPSIGFGGYRKPAFERPVYKENPVYKDNAGEQNAGYIRDYGNGPKDEDEELDNEDTDYGKHISAKARDNDIDSDSNDGDKIPYECYPWNCNPWYSVSPNSPYNSVGAAYKGKDGDLPPGASYNPRDVGLDESVVAQLNLPTPPVAPPMAAPLNAGYRGNYGPHGGPALDMPYSGSGQFPSYNGLLPHMPLRPRPRPRPYSASGMGFRSQYGYRAAASELSPQTAPSSSNTPVLSNLLNLNPSKAFRSLMSYLAGGIAG